MKTSFDVVKYVFRYNDSLADRNFLKLVCEKAKALSQSVNPGRANTSAMERSDENLWHDAIGGMLSEYTWRDHLNRLSGQTIIAYTNFESVKNQIDLIHIRNRKTLEVRSSFPIKGVKFALCHPKFEFDILGPYTNSVKRKATLKDFYLRTLIPGRKSGLMRRMKSEGRLEVYLTGGATLAMMKNPELVIKKSLRSQGAYEGSKPSEYLVIPFRFALDTPSISRLILEE